MLNSWVIQALPNWLVENDRIFVVSDRLSQQHDGLNFGRNCKILSIANATPLSSDLRIKGVDLHRPGTSAAANP